MGNFPSDDMEGGGVASSVSAMMDVGFKDSGM
jgi:hypothetical protein